MQNILPMQINQRCCDSKSQRNNFINRERRTIEISENGLAFDIFHHQIRLAREVPHAKTFGHMRPRQAWQDHHLHLEADNDGGIFAIKNGRDLHHDGLVNIITRDTPQGRHATGMDLLANAEAIDDGACFEQFTRHVCHLPIKRRAARICGKRAS